MVKNLLLLFCLLTGVFAMGYGKLSGISPEQQELITIHPNPVSDVLKVSFRLHSDFFIELYDMTGKRIVSHTFRSTRDSSEYSLQVNHLRQGLYLLKVYDRQGQVKKVFKIDKVLQ